MNTITMQHVQKENRQKPRVSAGFVAGAEGLVSAAASVGPGRSPPGCRPPRHALRRAQPCLVAKSYRTLTKKSGTAEAIPDFFGRGRRTCLGCRLGRFAAERHWRSLTPRHAGLEWMWENTAESGGETVLAGFRRKSQRGRCWFGAARKISGVKQPRIGGKSPEKHEIY